MAKKPSAIGTKQTKAQIISALAEATGKTKKEVGTVLDSMAGLAQRHLMKGGSGEFTVPALGIKLRRVIKPARPAREIPVQEIRHRSQKKSREGHDFGD